MKIKDIYESTVSGSVASVVTPLGQTQKRVGSLFKGKKTKKKFYEGKMKDLAYDIEHLDAGNFVKKYGQPKDFYTKKLGNPPSDKLATNQKTVHEAEITEQDLIIVPGMRRSKDTSFIPHAKDRRDHEVEMARSDLYAAAKDAMRIFKLLKDRSEDEGLMGWQQSYITLASDYLNSVADSMEYQAQVSEMTGGVLAGGMSNFESKYRGVPTKVQNMLDEIMLLRTQAEIAADRQQWKKVELINDKIEKTEEIILQDPKGQAALDNFYKSLGNKVADDNVIENKCPSCGGELVSEEMINEKKDACYYKVKSRYKVWPSAYASGALVKCRKKGASNWGKNKK